MLNASLIEILLGEFCVETIWWGLKFGDRLSMALLGSSSEKLIPQLTIEPSWIALIGLWTPFSRSELLLLSPCYASLMDLKERDRYTSGD